MSLAAQRSRLRWGECTSGSMIREVVHPPDFSGGQGHLGDRHLVGPPIDGKMSEGRHLSADRGSWRRLHDLNAVAHLYPSHSEGDMRGHGCDSRQAVMSQDATKLSMCSPEWLTRGKPHRGIYRTVRRSVRSSSLCSETSFWRPASAFCLGSLGEAKRLLVDKLGFSPQALCEASHAASRFARASPPSRRMEPSYACCGDQGYRTEVRRL